MVYADYDFYVGTFYGVSIAEPDFPRLAARASDFIDYYTRGKAAKATDETILAAVGKCCCAISEQMQASEKQKKLAALTISKAISVTNGEIPNVPDHELKSESVGGWSGSYVTAADYSNQNAADAQKAENAAYASIAMQYLANTGLLYRGGRC